MAKESKDPKEAKPKPQETFFSNLSEKAQQALSGKSSPIEYEPLAPDMELSPNALSALRAPIENSIVPDQLIARYGCVVMAAGEYPVLHLFTTQTALVNFISEKEGQDVAISLFYGLPILMTKGPNRYLVLPGGTQAICIPRNPVKKVQMVDATLLDSVEIQEDGFLGPEAFITTYQDRAVKEDEEPMPGEEDDDDDEDEEGVEQD